MTAVPSRRFKPYAAYKDSGVEWLGEIPAHWQALPAQEHGLSERQALALGHVLEHGRLTIQEFEALCPGANRRTLQRDLKAMVDKGLFAERGMGPTDPTRHYRLAEAIILGPENEL